jgi:hypothetical protein
MNGSETRSRYTRDVRQRSSAHAGEPAHGRPGGPLALPAIRMLADVGLRAHGYRTLTSEPGHHRTAIRTLPTTFGIDSQTLIRLACTSRANFSGILCEAGEAAVPGCAAALDFRENLVNDGVLGHGLAQSDVPQKICAGWVVSPYALR